VTVRTLDIAVVQGGPSAEAAVSRSSAEGVAHALEAVGHRVTKLELGPELAEKLRVGKPDVVFPVVHGTIGEDGCLQGLLEVLRLPYVGSGVLASALAADKIAAKVMFRAHALPVAEESLVARGEDLARAARRVRSELGPAVVVKPHAQGSAIGVTRVRADATDGDLARALELALSLDERALCERFVVGREVTCGVLDAPALGETRALPPTEILARAADFYDFRSRYGTGGSAHVCPAELGAEVTLAVQRVAFSAHRALGCRDLSRADFVVGDGADPTRVTLLEVNTLPGMTPTSLYPEAARISGIPMEQLCDALARSALTRGPRQLNAPIPLPP
jgi:D-alanine-D-alanine ligase